MKKILMVEKKKPSNKLEINLQDQTIKISKTGLTESFEINHYKKTCLLNGYDDIDYLLSIKGEIEEFEKRIPI